MAEDIAGIHPGQRPGLIWIRNAGRLTINLDGGIYGSFAEIGAGQEVVRWFFRVGGAAGTVAKSISAYDMAVSDAIYGKVRSLCFLARAAAGDAGPRVQAAAGTAGRGSPPRGRFFLVCRTPSRARIMPARMKAMAGWGCGFRMLRMLRS